MTALTISAVLSNYNDGRTVGDAIEAILSQSYKAHELIVVDDGSTDNSLEVITALARRSPVIKVIRNPTNRGLLPSCNHAFKAATGDYIYPASANDKTLPGLFEKCVSTLSLHPQAGLCHVDVKAADGRIYSMGLSEHPAYFSPLRLQGVFRRVGAITAGGGNSLIKRSAFAKAGYYIQDLKWNSDVFATTVVCAREGACYVPEPLVSVAVDTNSYSARGRRSLRAQHTIFRQMLGLLRSEEYRDVFEWIKRSGVWPMLDWAMLPVFIRDRELRSVVSSKLLAKMLYQGLRARVGSRMPSKVKRFLRVSGRGLGRPVLSEPVPGSNGSCTSRG